MRILRIKARNYRTLEDMTIEFASNYCAISGHNNAGKSCVVRLILHLLSENEATPWNFSDYSIRYETDKTQWNKDKEDISVEYNLTVNRTDDSSLVAILEKLSNRNFGKDDLQILVRLNVNIENVKSSYISVSGLELDNVSRREFLRTLRSSNNLLSHNSTTRSDDYYLALGRPMVMYDFFLSQKDRKSIEQAEALLQRHARKVARDHKTLLGSMLGKLKDNFDVDFSMPDISSPSRRMPLTINLSDRSVEVPLTSQGCSML